MHLHFDAQAAGFGSTGQTNVIHQDPALSRRQSAARVLASLVQRKSSSFKGCHVHAHDGQPWNEMADSIAKKVVSGWQPPVTAELRSRQLMDHPLKQWVWMQVCPTEEMPCLETVLQEEQPQPSQATIDATLDPVGTDQGDKQWYARLNVASINVGTLEQD